MSIFDAHFHIIDPRFPLVPNSGFLPPPFTVDSYLRRAAPLGITGGAVVSASFQGVDQHYLRDALTRLGPSFVGITQLPADVSDAEILDLNQQGVRGLRWNLRRGGSPPLADLERLGHRVFDLAGWHVELYVESSDLEQLFDRIVALPGVTIDHLGLCSEGLKTLLRLVERGVKVKASGFGRVDFDVAKVLRHIASVDPTALLFGSDLPSTRAARPFRNEDIKTLRTALGTRLARQALYENAVEFYRPLRAAGSE